MSVKNDSSYADLKDFKFRELLSADVSHKVAFMLLEKNSDSEVETNGTVASAALEDEKANVNEEKKDVSREKANKAVLILDKKPFSENAKDCQRLLNEANLRFEVQNDIYGSYHVLLPSQFNEIKSTLIFPADERQIDKYRYRESYFLEETAEDYETITLPWIQQSQMSIQWVYNVLEHKAEAERIIFEDTHPETGFLMAPDLKWDGTQKANLYVQAIVVKRGIKSVRDLTADHLPLLENIRDMGKKVLREKYGIRLDQIKAYLHYQPSFFHLHIHFVNLKFDAPASSTGQAILLDTVINNLQLMGDYYRKATLTFTRKAGDKLLKAYMDAKKGL